MREQQHYRPTRRHAKDHKTKTILLALCALALIVFGFGAYMVSAHFLSDQPEDPEALAPAGAAAGGPESASERRVSFLAVGDNLPETTIGAYADACAGEPGDGLYDYTPVFKHIKPYVEDADLAYIDFEVHAGGDDIGPRGYPSFNTTGAMVDAVFDTGFNMIASATNHSYDWGQSALEHSVSLWKKKDVLFTGTANDQADADTVKAIERNGIVFSLLNYTYGVNGYEESDIPAFAINYMHEDRIRNDISRAREISDVVIVSMHWGTENQTDPDHQQLAYAQVIADAGADVIIGSHPHVIGPVSWVEGALGNRTLVAYSLGNFISRHEDPDYLNELEGMLTCDFVKTDEGIDIEHVRWVPLVNHSEDDVHAVYALKDYTVELASRHRILSTLDDPLVWLKETSIGIVGTDAAVVTD